jgi:hypothetical protein
MRRISIALFAILFGLSTWITLCYATNPYLDCIANLTNCRSPATGTITQAVCPTPDANHNCGTNPCYLCNGTSEDRERWCVPASAGACAGAQVSIKCGKQKQSTCDYEPIGPTHFCICGLLLGGTDLPDDCWITKCTG